MADRKFSFSYDDLIECSKGNLFGKGNAQLPSPPMLMVDRIVDICEGEGSYKKGYLRAELDIHSDLWFFSCHFPGDPVMPGCLGLDALWQLTGFYLGWMSFKGKGRALGVGEVKFSGMVTPEIRRLTYHVHIKRLINRKLVLGIADGVMEADGNPIYTTKDMRVGLFKDSP